MLLSVRNHLLTFTRLVKRLAIVTRWMKHHQQRIKIAYDYTLQILTTPTRAVLGSAVINFELILLSCSCETQANRPMIPKRINNKLMYM